MLSDACFPSEDRRGPKAYPSRDLIRLRHNWYKETRELPGPHVNVYYMHNPNQLTETVLISETSRAMALQLLVEVGAEWLLSATGEAHQVADVACTDNSARAGEATP